MDVQQLQLLFPNLEFKENVLLSPYTYMKVGGPASIYVEIHTTDDLFAVCSQCFTKKIPFVVLGGASNVIIPDSGIDKLVIRNLTNQIQILKTEGDKTVVQADSGVVTAILANKTMEQNLSGLEYFIGVPGTIGGAIFNNSHYTAHELIGQLVDSVEICTQAGTREHLQKEQLEFGYDYSIFHNTPAVILSVTFSLFKDDPEKIKERTITVAKRRVLTQPVGIPSSGCMYKNPSLSESELKNLELKVEIPQSAIKKISEGTFNVAAGFLIDQAGLKRTSVGGASVSDKHATFLINTGTATSKDIEALCQKIESVVLEKFGVKLEREVFFLS